MEYIEGSSCAEILRDDGWVEVAEALSIIEQACEGLDYAHRHGVVHRDVKPGNLLRSREGEVKLADFGIAKATEQSSITQVGSVLGTAAYLAPEQARGEEAGPSADLYALGVVTYQLISGRLPYEATSLTELALKQQQEAAADARHARGGGQPGARPTRSRSRSRSTPATATRPRARCAAALHDGARGIPPGASVPADARRARHPGDERARGRRRASAAAGADRAPRAVPAAGAAAQQPAAAPGRAARRAARRRAAPARPARGVLLGAARGRAADRGGGRRRDRRHAPRSTKVVLRNVVYSDVHKSTTALKQLVAENTK